MNLESLRVREGVELGEEFYVEGDILLEAGNPYSFLNIGLFNSKDQISQECVNALMTGKVKVIKIKQN